MSEEITLDSLISEGEEIKKSIQYRNSDIVGSYSFNHTQFEPWKSTCIRFLGVNFPEDRCMNDFEIAVKEFNTFLHYTPKKMDAIIGVLKSAKLIPNKVITKESNSNNTAVPVIINNHNEQTQSTSINIDIFIEAIKDELKVGQLMELKAIAAEEKDPQKAKSKIIGKLKSFGTDVASNVLANIITTPSIWTKLLAQAQNVI